MVSNNTLEGENYVIIQQLSRYLYKTFKAAQKGTSPVGNAKYLEPIAKNHQYLTVEVGRPEDLLKTKNQLNAFANRAGYIVAQMSQRMDQEMAKGKSLAAALQSVQWLAIRAGKAHCMYSMLVSFIKFAEASKNHDPALYPVLKSLCDLFALYHTEKELGEFLEASQYSPKQSGWIHEQVEQLLRKIRPEAVRLVDAFNFSDRDLNSALGRYDGDVYKALLDWTKKDPLNQDDVIFCYDEVIRPIIKKDFKSKL